jgi:excisionase family DNA binding protein
LILQHFTKVLQETKSGGGGEVRQARNGTLYALVSQGRIPHIRLGKRIVRFSAKALDAWLAENTVGTKTVEKAP